MKRNKPNTKTRKNNKNSTYNFIIKNIFDIDKETLKELDEHQTKCWKEKDKISRFQANWVKKDKRNFYVIYLQNEKDKITFSSVLSEQIIRNEPFIYIRGVCVSPSEQGKGIYKNSLIFVKNYFKHLGFQTIRLNAETETVNEIDQSTRLKIFHKSGLTLDPITIDYKNNNKIYDTIVKLKDGSFVKILKFDYEKNSYKVQTENKKIKHIDIDMIDFCTKLKEKYVCPMVLQMITHK